MEPFYYEETLVSQFLHKSTFLSTLSSYFVQREKKNNKPFELFKYLTKKNKIFHLL